MIVKMKMGGGDLNSEAGLEMAVYLNKRRATQYIFTTL
jgi:hypothetical protein